MEIDKYTGNIYIRPFVIIINSGSECSGTGRFRWGVRILWRASASRPPPSVHRSDRNGIPSLHHYPCLTRTSPLALRTTYLGASPSRLRN
jgi:hypothetical protein